MKPSHDQIQACITCDQPIIGEPYHAIIGGNIFRFCSSHHRQEFRAARVQLMERDHAHA